MFEMLERMMERLREVWAGMSLNQRIVSAALLAALMSTTDSLINAVSAITVNDIYRPFLRKGASDAHYLAAARTVAIVAALVGVVLVGLVISAGDCPAQVTPADAASATQPAGLPPAADTQQMLRQADALLQAGRLDSAARLYHMVRVREPGLSVVLLRLAQVYRLKGEDGLAIRYCQEYTQREPVDPQGYFELGTLYLRAKYYQQAKFTLQRATKLNDRHAQAHANLALAHLGLHEYREAIAEASRAVALDPNDPQIRQAAAFCFLDGGRPADALVHAQAAIRLCRQQLAAQPADVDLLRQLDFYYDLLQKVLASWQSQLQQAGQAGRVAEACLQLARAIEEQADIRRVLAHHAALRWLEDARRASPGNLQVLEQLLVVQHEVGLISQAVETCRQILKLRPGHPAAKD